MSCTPVMLACLKFTKVASALTSHKRVSGIKVFAKDWCLWTLVEVPQASKRTMICFIIIASIKNYINFMYESVVIFRPSQEHKSVTVNATVLGVWSPLGGMNYCFYIYFHFFALALMQIPALSSVTQHAVRHESGGRSVFTLGSLCLAGL